VITYFVLRDGGLGGVGVVGAETAAGACRRLDKNLGQFKSSVDYVEVDELKGDVGYRVYDGERIDVSGLIRRMRSDTPIAIERDLEDACELIGCFVTRKKSGRRS
jgi:hypothetical protein